MIDAREWLAFLCATAAAGGCVKIGLQVWRVRLPRARQPYADWRAAEQWLYGAIWGGFTAVTAAVAAAAACTAGGL